ncbi:MAG: hypothetical protein E6Y04_08190 [Corynebacterium sp.]|uniref:hypothetical protein n=1 Tax=Corynebacterium sp. TaxID=1720 RepID=UPI00290BB30A|nr:hypothetical protein [Corynebacterium sp.]MDU4729934.1 hypothetical protein [Corynebacterium sp.]
MDWGRFKRRASRWLVSDAAGLFILGSISIARGLSYTPLLVDPERKPTHFMESVLNPPSWAVVWLLMGALCLCAVKWPRLVPAAVGAVVGLHSMWALSFIFATVFGDLPRAWVSSLGYIGIAAMTLYAYGRGQTSELKIVDGR